MSLLGHRHTSRQALILLLGVVLTLAGLVAVANTARAATDPCAAGGNPIACENSKPGTDPSEWQINGMGDPSIQGFSTDISVNVGSRIDFKIDTNARAYDIDVYRLGYYGGLGARKITALTPSVSLPQTQPNCINDATTGLTDCGNWAVSASWNVPSTAVSGVYIARLYRPDTNGASEITFIVRDDSSHSAVVFQTSDPTWQAYNTYGGSDFYQGAANGRAYKISYNRPIYTRDGVGGRDFFFSNEYPLVRFLERNGYDVSYLAGVDTDRYGSELLNHKVFLSVGHDEYW
ncbi:N,N-dimethylformamidase beta subunit family domain-containing protein, partial [Nocardioides panacihumi]